jgi:hypothetical protein
MCNRVVLTTWAFGTAFTLVACGSADQAKAPSTENNSITTSAAAPPSAPAVQPWAKNWFDLDVGDCLVDLPQVDLGEVSVDIVDCANPHAGEVFLRAPVEVDAAIAGVADQKCAAGVAGYTGRPARDAFTVTYLIDSNQDRTSDNPLPSTVICVLQAGGGQQLTGSAHNP